MKIPNLRTAILVATLAALHTSASASLESLQPAKVAKYVPFSASYSTQLESTFVFPILQLTISGEGTATHLGRSTAATTDQQVNILTGQATATYTLTAVNGDTVVVELTFHTTNTAPSPITFEGTYVVTGGTGRFAGSTGNGLLTGSAVFTGPTSGVGQFTLSGKISSRGSSS